MLTTSLLRRLALLLVLVFFATPWAWAARPAARATGPSRVAEASPANLFDRAWRFLADFWAKEGGHIDPDGVTTPPVAPSADTGGHLDPDGSAKLQPSFTAPTDTGCNIDPDGRCHF